MSDYKYILSIDGGGVRGMIALYALQELEKQKGQRAKDIFSFMAGTSTGGIIIAALALGIPAEKIIGLYRELVGKVFRGGLYVQGLESVSRAYAGLARAGAPFKRQLGDLSNLADAAARLPGHLYPSRHIASYFRESVQKYTGRDPESIVLDDLDVDVLITAHGVQDGHTWYFVKSKPEDFIAGSAEKKHRTTGDLKLVDCVTGSASAPTYFSPWKIDERVGSNNRLIGYVADGGVTTANNPVYQACVEAFEYMPDQQYKPLETVVVSLGTGRRSGSHLLNVPDDLLEWLKWSFGMLLESPARQQLDFVHRHYPNTRLYRIDQELKEDIDLGDPTAISRLEKYGSQLAGKLAEPGADWSSILAGEENHWLYRCQREERRPGATLAAA